MCMQARYPSLIWNAFNQNRNTVNDNNHYKDLVDRVTHARRARESLRIMGSGSKQFYGRSVSGTTIDMRDYRGIIAYEPTELYITVRAGTPVREIETRLMEQGQMLAFEPPHYGDGATIGGVVATGLSGPRRPYTGSVRDYVLGIKCLSGHGEILNFGGQVMKNVAGYDVARLMTGALGTLGILLEITLKVWPRPEQELTLSGKMKFDQAIQSMNTWAGKPLSLSAACYDGERLHIRLSGKSSAVAVAAKQLPLQPDPAGADFWEKLREQQLDYFNDERPLWRLSVPTTTGKPDLSGEWLIDWGGAQRWLRSEDKPAVIFSEAKKQGGHAMLFRGGDRTEDVFQPLPASLMQLHLNLKQKFDPDRIFNRGCLYRDI